MSTEAIPTPTDPTVEETPVPAKPSVFVLGPCLDSVIEPFPVVVDDPTGVTTSPGRRQITFRDPATVPGGIAQLQILPPVDPADVLPINVYAFFVQPIESVPALADRTPDWFFKSGAPSGSIHIGAAGEDGAFDVTVPGVKPSLAGYFVQIVVEFRGS